MATQNLVITIPKYHTNFQIIITIILLILNTSYRGTLLSIYYIFSNLQLKFQW